MRRPFLGVERASADRPLRRADIAAAKLVLRKRGATGAVLPNKQRVDILLDGAMIAHFKSKAGDRGYQTLINEALRLAIQGPRPSRGSR